jgi:hypothetical protein
VPRQTPGCIQQWLSMDDVDRLPIGNRVGEIGEDARQKKMVKMDWNSIFFDRLKLGKVMSDWTSKNPATCGTQSAPLIDRSAQHKFAV